MKASSSAVLVGILMLASGGPVIHAQGNLFEAPDWLSDSGEWGLHASGFREWFGPTPKVVIDEGTGFVRSIYDLGAQQWRSFDETSPEDAARSFIDSFGNLFGFDSTTLELRRVWYLPLEEIGSTDKIAVTFDQRLSDIPVHQGWVTVLFDEHGGLLAVENHGAPGIQEDRGLLDSRIGEREAVSLCADAFGHDLESVRSLEKKILVHRDGGGAQTRLAWFVELRARYPRKSGVPIQEEWVLDAHTGERLSHRSTIYEVDLIGNTEGWATPGDCPDWSDNPEVLVPLSDVRMSSSVGVSDSNVDGDWTIPYGGQQNQNVTATFNSSSTFVWVDDRGGSDISLTQSVTPGVPAQFTLNASRTQFDTAEVNAQWHSTRMRHWIHALSPGDDTMDFRLRENVNRGDASCTAWWDGSSTNYFRAGSGCPNTAYSSVVQHENGHWAVARYNGSVSGAMHEGIADTWALYVLDTDLIGKDLFGPGNHRRYGDNNTDKCPQNCGESCHGGETHREGEVIMGTFWSMRSRFNASMGDAQGDLTAHLLFLGWLQAYDDSQICNNIYTHILTLDDDDGNLSNGTPHCADIQGAFEEDKGWPDLHDCAPPQDCPDSCAQPVAYGEGTPGSGGLIPQISNHNGCAYINNRNFEVRADNALGGASGLLLIGFDATDQDQGGWTLLVDTSTFGLVLPVNYSGAGAGQGQVAVSLPIPNNPFLDGTDVYFQFTVNDGGAPSGVAATQGLEVILCDPE